MVTQPLPLEPVRKSETETETPAQVAALRAQVCTRARGTAVTVARHGGQLGRHWASRGKATLEQITASPLAEQHPASVAEMRGYIESASWVPGEIPVLEFLGRVYGYAVAIPVCLLLYGVSFVVQRPGRFLITAIVTTIFIVCWTL